MTKDAEIVYIANSSYATHLPYSLQEWFDIKALYKDALKRHTIRQKRPKNDSE